MSHLCLCKNEGKALCDFICQSRNENKVYQVEEHVRNLGKWFKICNRYIYAHLFFSCIRVWQETSEIQYNLF